MHIALLNKGPFALSAALALAACSFPDVYIIQGTSSTSTSSSASSTTASSTSAQGSGGGGVGGVGGEGATSGTGGGQGGGAPCTPGDCALHADKDNDGHADTACTPEQAGSLPNDDCDDCNGDVFPGQTAWFDQPRAGAAVRYDYDCNGVDNPRYESANCAGLLGLGCNATNIFGGSSDMPVPCGTEGPYGDCVAGLGTCSFAFDEIRTQGCH